MTPPSIMEFPQQRRVIKSLEIHGLWGHKNLKIAFFDELSILIGKNGSGKTSILKIIHAIFNHQFHLLGNFDFNNIELTCGPKGHNADLKIIIHKSQQKSHLDSVLIYQDIMNNNVLFHSQISTRMPMQNYSNDPKVIFRGPNNQNQPIHLSQVLALTRKFASVSWLPVDRTRQPDNGTAVQNTSVKFTDTVLSDYVKFVSSLNSNIEILSRDFQKNVFSHLLNAPIKIDRIEALKDYDITRLEAALSNIQKELSIKNVDIMPNIKSINESLKHNISSVNMTDKAAFSYHASILMPLADLWSKYEISRSKIDSRRLLPIETLNSFFEEIKSEVLPGNQITFHSKSDIKRKINLQSLSSGERQIITMIFWHYLQDGNSISMCDEPEISLHIDWQEKLLRALMEVNPESQIIVATHSPDIVSSFQKSIIKV